MEENTEMWRVNVQSELNQVKTDIRTLQDTTLIHDVAISTLKTNLTEIKDDTKWLRRTLTNAFIVLVIGGSVGIVFAAIKIIGGQ